MKKNRFLLFFALLIAVGLVLSACGTTNEDDNAEDQEDTDSTEGTDAGDFSVAMVTDIGGVDDKSFNQSAWEGLKAFGEENGLSQGSGIDYAQSSSDADYSPNLNRLVKGGNNLVFGIGFLLADSLQDVAGQNPDAQFAIVDSVVEGDNVANITFKEHQGSFLVGVAAAQKTESKKLGFVGGEESELIKRFETGFIAGVKSVDPEIEVNVQYADSFGDAAKGKAIASNMYNSGIDIIYHASGGTGNGVFAQALDIKNSDPDANVWVIGVDRDQYEEGAYGDGNSVTFTSMLKRVDVAVQSVAQMALDGEFPGGEILEFGLEDEGIGVAKTNEDAYTAEIDEIVQEWQQKILDGDLEVPTTDSELEEYLGSL